MNKLKPHTRNQRRMYRIHKQEERIYNLELLVGSLQLFYLRSSEYLNQLKFERDKEFVDMTHRNTELLEENKKLKEVIDKTKNYIKNNKLYSYIYDEEELFEIITDEVAKEKLLDILKEVE